VDAYKGFSLQREGLPAILQLHLKRFKYDYDTGETSKINDRCSFPLELDLSELTDHNREDDDEDINDIYDLQSIVIHKGDYGSGHYYSYVRPEIHLDEWYRFDDEFVTRVYYTDVIADAYGGNNALLQRKRSRSDSFESVDSQQHEVQQQQRGLLRRIFPLFGLFRRSRTPERRGGFGYGGRTSNAYMLQYVHRSDVPKLYPATHH
jgi:ubiquitin carboxyl-terminal hydrolase 7